MLKKSKRGDEKYYLMISLILGIIVLGLSLYFIFQEYFNQNEIDWETCRQSIILRATMPADYISSGKDAFPLKCKTEKVMIETRNKTEAAKIIADKVAQVFYTGGNGKLELFPRNFFTRNTYCLILARVTIDQKLREEYSNSNNYIPVWQFIKSEKLDDKVTYLDYLYQNYANDPRIKKCGDNIKSDKFRDELGTPEYWNNTNEDLFIVMIYLNKMKNMGPSLGIGSCGVEFSWSGDELPPSIAAISSLKQIQENCEVISTIPA
ncbi:MAG: hypothetical protein WCP89_00745 [archaeon]